MPLKASNFFCARPASSSFIVRHGTLNLKIYERFRLLPQPCKQKCVDKIQDHRQMLEKQIQKVDT